MDDRSSQNTKEEPNEVEEAEDELEDSLSQAKDEEIGVYQHDNGHKKKKAESTLVQWDGENDPENPQNWSRARRWWITTITGLLTFAVVFGSSVFSAATAVTATEFGVGEEVMILGVALYVLGFACGPLFWGPLSEYYGRRNPLMGSLFIFIIFQIPVARATNLQTVLVGRFLGGAFGSAPLAIIAGILVDIWDASTRAIAVVVFVTSVFVGPSLGPVVGEFTVKNTSLGWRWTLWFTMIMSAFFWILALPTLPETLAPVLLQKKAARLRYETKNWALHSTRDEEPVHAGALLEKYGLKPIKMIVLEPTLLIMTIYISLVYGILYLIFFFFPLSFAYDRHFETGVASLPFIAIFVGFLSAAAALVWHIRAVFNPKMMKKKELVPEERLPPMIAGSIILVIGLFWFAWTSAPSINPWPQILSGIFIGGGIIMVFVPALIYLVDVYLLDASSAMSVNTVVRSFVGAAFPLFSTYMFKDLGVHWASSVLAFLCLALVPAPISFYIYGKRIRSWSRFASHLA